MLVVVSWVWGVEGITLLNAFVMGLSLVFKKEN